MPRVGKKKFPYTKAGEGAASISLPNQYDRDHLCAQGDGTINIYRID